MKKVLYLISNTFFYVFSFFFVMVFILSLLSFFEKHCGVNVPLVEILGEKEEFNSKINLPFVNATIQYNFSLNILFMWFWLLFYAIYFFTLKDFFKIFTEKNVFSNRSIVKLKLFFRLNIIPLLICIGVILHSFLNKKNESLEEEYTIVFIHLCIAVIVYLYFDIFKKGKTLQEENDLTI